MKDGGRAKASHVKVVSKGEGGVSFLHGGQPGMRVIRGRY